MFGPSGEGLGEGVGSTAIGFERGSAKIKFVVGFDPTRNVIHRGEHPEIRDRIEVFDGEKEVVCGGAEDFSSFCPSFESGTEFFFGSVSYGFEFERFVEDEEVIFVEKVDCAAGIGEQEGAIEFEPVEEFLLTQSFRVSGDEFDESLAGFVVFEDGGFAFSGLVHPDRDFVFISGKKDFAAGTEAESRDRAA